jgi:hypothetical protein
MGVAFAIMVLLTQGGLMRTLLNTPQSAGNSQADDAMSVPHLEERTKKR